MFVFVGTLKPIAVFVFVDCDFTAVDLRPRKKHPMSQRKQS